MAVVRPFKAIRPAAEYAGKFASLAKVGQMISLTKIKHLVLFGTL